MDLLTDAIVMGESPRWHDGRLYVSDWGSGTIVAVDQFSAWLRRRLVGNQAFNYGRGE